MKLNDMMYFKKDRFNKLMVLCDYTDPNEGIVLPEPFQNLSIKDMIELDKRVSVHEINHGHSSLRSGNHSLSCYEL